MGFFVTLSMVLGDLLMIFLYLFFFFLDRISLITKDEAKESSVTSEEAEKVSFFLMNNYLYRVLTVE